MIFLYTTLHIVGDVVGTTPAAFNFPGFPGTNFRLDWPRSQRQLIVSFLLYWIYGARPIPLLTNQHMMSDVVSIMLATFTFHNIFWYPF